MSNSIFAGLMARRNLKVGATTASVAVLALLAVMQGIGGASAASETETGKGWDCAQGTACLWNNVHKDGNSSEKLIITPDKIPDMETGTVRSTTPGFHDNISEGLNLSPFDLCMIDTEPLDNGEYRSWGAIVVISAEGGDFLAGHEQQYSDTFDTYTTARPGECPSYVRFKGADSSIIESS
jgi:hypothetical protein